MSSTFSFGFFDTSRSKGDAAQKHVSSAATPQEVSRSSRNGASAQEAPPDRPLHAAVVPFRWMGTDDFAQRFQERMLQELVYREIPVQQQDGGKGDDDDEEGGANGQRRLLRCVDRESTLTTQTTESAPHLDVVQPGIYEGGGTVWECSVDLVNYLAEQLAVQPRRHKGGDDDVAPVNPLWTLVNDNALQQQHGEDNGGGAGSGRRYRRVLELGCGHALPSCFLLEQTLRRQQQQEHAGREAHAHILKDMLFFLVDYNAQVLHDVVISNLVLASAAAAAGTDANGAEASKAFAEIIREYVRLGSGDWMDMSAQLQQQQHDDRADESSGGPSLPTSGRFALILAAETLYTEKAAEETATLLARHLHRDGTALIATKRYYFGVGGGSDVFCQALSTMEPLDGRTLHATIVQTYDNGKGNIREILQVSWQ